MDIEHSHQARGWDWERQPRGLHVRRYALGVDAPTSREFQGGREGVHAGSGGRPVQMESGKKKGAWPEDSSGGVWVAHR